MPSAVTPYMRAALLLVILIGLALAVARAVPHSEHETETRQLPLPPPQQQFQIQAGSETEIMPPSMVALVPSPVESGGDGGYNYDHRSWRELLRLAWGAVSPRPNPINAPASLHSGRRKRYLRRARAHP